jgi:hypothetical protein
MAQSIAFMIIFVELYDHNRFPLLWPQSIAFMIIFVELYSYNRVPSPTDLYEWTCDAMSIAMTILLIIHHGTPESQRATK